MRGTRLSVVMEWANTRLHGVGRAALVIDEIRRQWRGLVAGGRPADLSAEGAAFLDGLAPELQVLVVSGEPLDAAARDAVGDAAEVHVAEGLEYYPLKNFGAARADGDLLLFVDSDVMPEPDWLAHLLGTFGRADVEVACGQTYVAPDGVFASAFALGWTYDLRDDTGRLFEPVKYYANNIAFRAPVFRATGFPDVGRRTRGAATMLRAELHRRGVRIWENRRARVGHPPPQDLRHLVVRALAHGRDHYMKFDERRHVRGLARSVGVAFGRLGRGCWRTFRHGRRVGLKLLQVPAVLAIQASYYAFFALGGVLTHVSPTAMARRFRV